MTESTAAGGSEFLFLVLTAVFLTMSMPPAFSIYRKFLKTEYKRAFFFLPFFIMLLAASAIIEVAGAYFESIYPGVHYTWLHRASGFTELAGFAMLLGFSYLLKKELERAKGGGSG